VQVRSAGMSALPLADLTATATLVLAAAALVLALATVGLVLATRAATVDARRAARAELDAVQRQLAAGYRPVLVDVLRTAPAPDDMDSQLDVAQQYQDFDPRTVFVKVDAAAVFISVPLRNVGRGLAVIDPSGVGISGPGIGQPESRAVQRAHVPIGETTRIDITAAHATGEPIAIGTVWDLRVPYADFAGAQRTVVSLHVVCRGEDAQGPWLVERVDQMAAGAREAAVAREPAAIPEPAGDEPTPADQAPSIDEVPATEAPGPKRGVRGEPVTDVWGNPVRKPKRRGRS
jgi:hypothetical protein